MRVLLSLPAVLVCLGLMAQTPAPAPQAQPSPAAEPAPAATPGPAAGTPQATPAATDEAQPAVAKTPDAAASTDANAVLLFYRESRFIGAALRPSIFVDDMEVAWISSGSYFKVPVAPGDHVIYADEKDSALTFPTEPGKTYYFRVGVRAGLFKGHGKLEPVSEEAGVKEFGEWKPKLTYTKKILKPEMVLPD